MSLRDLLRRSALSLVPLLLLMSVASAATRPNVVLILVDDFGYECVAANGGTSYRTPHLDKLSAGGMRFEHCYVQPLCTPTRVQLMTGIYNYRNYTRFVHLDETQTTFAHLFRKAGYSTCMAGKWQLGRKMSLPGHFGFDSFCLWQLTRRPPRYANPGLEIDGRELDYTHGEYGPDIVNKYVLDFIANHRAKPFCLYYPMMLTHDPYQPTPDSPDWDPQAIGEQVNKDPKHFADMVAYADKLIGTVVASLEQHGLRENTLLLVVGDNGTKRDHPSQMGPRTVIGGKGTSKVTGTHVPLIVNWPGTIPAGRVSQDLVDSTDFLPTICEAAGVSVPAELQIDGHSFLPQLRGEKGSPRDWTYCWFAREGGEKATFEFAMNQRYKLYRGGQFIDLTRDPEEEHPLAADSLGADARAGRTTLTAALEKFSAPRPAKFVSQAGPPPAAGKAAE